MRWFFVLILPFSAYPAFEPVGLEGDIHRTEGIYISPASIYGNFGISTDYIIPFGMSELTMHRIGMRLPSRVGSFGLIVSDFGSPTYRENELSFGYGNRYRTINFGLFSKLYYISTKDYGSILTPSLDIGITSFLYIGSFYLAIRDITNPSIKGDRIGSTIVGGMYLSPGDWFDMELRLTKQERFPVNTKVMGLFNIHQFLRLKVGVNTFPASIIGGISVSARKFGMSYITTIHQVLGLSHIIRVSFE